MANNGIAPGRSSNFLPYSPSYGIVGGIPVIEVTGTPLKGISAWDRIVAGFRRTTGSLFKPMAPPSMTLTPDQRGLTPQPGTIAESAAPLVAIVLLAAAGYITWKAVR